MSHKDFIKWVGNNIRRGNAKKRKEVLKKAKDEILDVRVIHEKE